MQRDVGCTKIIAHVCKTRSVRRMNVCEVQVLFLFVLIFKYFFTREKHRYINYWRLSHFISPSCELNLSFSHKNNFPREVRPSFFLVFSQTRNASWLSYANDAFMLMNIFLFSTSTHFTVSLVIAEQKVKTSERWNRTFCYCIVCQSCKLDVVYHWFHSQYSQLFWFLTFLLSSLLFIYEHFVRILRIIKLQSFQSHFLFTRK